MIAKEEKMKGTEIERESKLCVQSDARNGGWRPFLDEGYQRPVLYGFRVTIKKVRVLSGNY